MGTSVSNPGPPSCVPLIPPWVGEINPIEPEFEENDQDGVQEINNGESSLEKVAPAGRFRGARINLGKFAKSGSSSNMQKGLCQYARKGLGGSHKASQRMTKTVQKAGRLYDALHALSSGKQLAVDLGIDTSSLIGLPAHKMIERISEALCPIDGTQDTDASRQSISQALSDLVHKDPEINLAALSQEQIELAIQLFIGEDIIRRIELDVGGKVFEKAPNLSAAVQRLDEMARYVHQSVTACFHRVRTDVGVLTQKAATRLASDVIKEVFLVFESYGL